MSQSRREFIKKATVTSAGLYMGANAFGAKSYRNILGANDRVRVGVVGFSDRHRSSHIPCFMNHYKELNFDVVAVSDIWKKRREDGAATWKDKMGHDVVACRNNEELYDKKLVDCSIRQYGRFSTRLTCDRSRESRVRCILRKTLCRNNGR
jgi:hypothetical protein